MTAPPTGFRDRPAGAGCVVLSAAVLLTVLPIALAAVRPSVNNAGNYGSLFPFAAVLVTLSYWRGYRILGLIPPAVALSASSRGYATITDSSSDIVAYLSLGSLGVIFGAVIRYTNRGVFHQATRNNVPHRAPRIDIVTGVVLGVTFIVGMALARFAPPDHPDAVIRVLDIGWIPLLVFSWVRLFREFFELCVEPVLWLSFRVRGTGPGLDAVPYHGPLIVIANHSCWWDPLFIAKLMPRPITPMMTSKFFDIWFLRPLMVYVFRTIRVPDGTVRRVTPEIAQAVAALDAGECVVLFPEGYLRRKEDQPLRRFGRGMWEILRARPDTPIVACWIEGNWGSWTSFAGGPPTKNKSPDFRRRIDVGMSAPVILPAEMLADHLTTRYALMDIVADARKYLGLPPLAPFDRPSSTAETDQPE